MNTKKMTASLVGVMLIATVLVMAASAAGMDRSKYADMPRMVYEFDADDDTGIYVNDLEHLGVPTVPTVRVYGEADAIYPTQSYTGADDFIYPDPVDAFDPGVIGKDSVTFNPAYLDNEYEYTRKDGVTITEAISVDSEDSDEKVFLRVFYEPGYGHEADAKMYYHYDDLTTVLMDAGAIVTETTYMLLEDNLQYQGHAGLPKTGGDEGTHFMLPVASWDVEDVLPGMDRSSMVYLSYAEHGGMTTAGTIEVEESYDSTTYGLSLTDVVSFMDHELTLVDFNSDGDPMFTIRYVGNMDYYHDKKQPHTIEKDEKLYFNRGNLASAGSDPAYRWYLEVTEMTAGEPVDKEVHIKVGRRLVAGETFYVDGIRYDMPAIYVTDEDKFKYITFQSPIPKCPVLWDPPLNMPDWSHVTSQWLANLDVSTAADPHPVWMLPPFNEQHTMIDDIGLDKVYDAVDDCWYLETEAGNILLGDVDTLEFHYIDEATEGRFDSSLAERHAYDGSDEIWNWWSIFTKPYQYTEFWLPDQETTVMADGNEYLITTSFIAPNCEAEEREKVDDKSSDEVHDIIDRASEIAVDGDERRDAYNGMPRMVFEYDAVDTEDLFVNDDGVDPTVRVYGEEGAIYPTQSFTGADDFIYPDPVDAFDPGVIGKDSVTFNPAYLDNEYEYTRKDGVTITEAISVDSEDSDEKVFLRVFYEPGYGHEADAKMYYHYDDLTTVLMDAGAIVTETTYMLLEDNLQYQGHAGLPKTGGDEGTHFMLPVASWDVEDVLPGMDRSSMVYLSYAEHGGMTTAGTIEVEESYDSTTYGLSLTDVVSFMDHELTLVDFNSDGDPMFTIRYVGNMDYYHDKKQPHTIEKDEKLYFNRGNLASAGSDPAYRWYLEVTEMTAGEPVDKEVHIKVGRRLVAGETFYVDGIRYDMPAIYVTDEDKFKYITFQSPIPKCPVLWDPPLNMPDWSHVTSQWLANLDEGMVVWVLPPFNEDHTMIDDIGLDKVYDAVDDCWYLETEAGNILLGDVDTLEFHYIDEATEGRFDSSLAERHAYDGSDEIWNWWSIFTKPYQYTEFWLPDQETTVMADGNEYLITTSFIAPNSEEPGAERGVLCKSSDEVHDIIDRAATLDGEPPLVLTTITVSPTTAELVVDDTEIFTATTRDQNGDPITATVTWDSSNTTVGLDPAAGMSTTFTALVDGTTTITATAQGVTSNAVTVTVNVSEETLLEYYDTNKDGIIDKDEAIAAITDYFDDKISKEDAIEVITAYFG